MKVVLAFGGLSKPGGITMELRNLEHGLEGRGVEVITEDGLPAVLRHLRRGDNDILHVFGCLPSATIFGGLAGAKACHRKVVWTPVFHPARPQYWIGSGLHRPMQLFDHVAPRAARHVDAVVTATAEEAEYFERLGSPVVSLNPSVVTRTQAPLAGAARRAARAHLGLGDVPIVLMVAAHSARRKGMPFARATFRELRRRVPNATLLVVGGGDTDGLVEDDGVVVAGWCSNEDLAAAYGCADVLFVPSRFEQFSRATLEGWAHELPVVVSDGVALAPLVEGRAGLVVPFGDAVAASAAIEATLGDPDLARRFGTAGRELADTRFTLDGHVSRMLKLYSGLLSSPAPPHRTRSARAGGPPSRRRATGRSTRDAGAPPRADATRGRSSDARDAASAAAYFAAPNTVIGWWDPLDQGDPDMASWMAAQIDDLLAVCPVEGRRVLDAASGRGRAAIECARRGASEVVAIDVSEDMLAAALEHASRAGVATRIDFRLGAVSDLDPAGQGFDVAFLLEVLLHLDDPGAAMRRLHDVLAPGGALVVTSNGANPLARLSQPRRRSGRPARPIELAMATLTNELMTPVFGFVWGRTRRTAALYQRLFSVPVRPLTPSKVRRLLRAAGFTSIYHRAARQGPFPRDHRWVAVKSSARGDEPPRRDRGGGWVRTAPGPGLDHDRSGRC